jgi:DNA-binding transcriptional MocR family regulator
MNLSFGAKECWRILERFPSGSCYPSHYYIAEAMRKSLSAVRRYLVELKERGYIGITPRYDIKPAKGPRPRGQYHPRGQTSNNYTILDQPDLIARARQIVQDWEARRKKQEG